LELEAAEEAKPGREVPVGLGKADWSPQRHILPIGQRQPPDLSLRPLLHRVRCMSTTVTSA
jgi:hypothetical protein